MAARILCRSLRSLNSSLGAQNIVKHSGYLYKIPQPISLASIVSNTSIRTISTSRVLKTNNVTSDLANFIAEEVKLEKDARKEKAPLAKINGFEIKTEGPNVTLSKTHGSEQITITFNVNGSLDDEQNMDSSLSSEKADTQAEAEVNIIIQ